jgi:hypothetical protein
VEFDLKNVWEYGEVMAELERLGTMITSVTATEGTSLCRRLHIGIRINRFLAVRKWDPTMRNGSDAPRALPVSREGVPRG